MALLIELAGRTFALEHDGTGSPQAADGGLILPPGRVALLHGLGDALFYRHGQNSWSPCGWRRLSEPPLRIANPQRRVTADDDVWDDPARHHSSAVAALDTGDGNVLLLGALGLGTPRLTADRDTLAGWYERGASPWFAAYGPEEEVFAAYTRHLAARLGSSTRRAGNVWCSWYAYYETITEQQLAKDINDLRGLPFDVVQIDDGWERLVGDWQPNHKFPSGMRALVDRITDVGMVAGLWLAPFIALPSAGVPRSLLLRDARGDLVIAGHNWGTGYHALDLSRSDTLDYLGSLIDRVVHEWGFRYLKLDFINAGAVPGVRLDDAEREQTYRDALALVRQVAGDDVYLLGSGAILLPSLGILDGLRSGPDVAPMWQNYASDDPSDAMARNAVVNTLHRLWHQPVVEVDPDVIYFRSRLNLLTDQQLAWLRDLADVSRFRAVSDPPSWLTPGELDDMRTYLSTRPEIRRLSRYEYTIDGRAADFTGAVSPAAAAYPIS
ncbi:alpha-galactosidase [Asanoa ishikariensis]|uniref:Alpha-galactosidase n=1 Tax=Asanoa ishikariensis TaxID=137265 RepID=A0A1H3UZ03_9ACTN|nr:glycoside hydrolase family 36 protein [Asanoa ishikariensis]GIF69999.1 alpha-galactosidase [Asanoa ishikariensis]SDZ67201.1 alpha-galactosidase [Asanoa ishikariensis]